MDAEMKERLTSRDLWMRALYMLFFVIAYSVAEIVLTLVVIFQFLTVLFTGSANEAALRFGHNLGIYVRQILQFETFNSEDRPFPFADWPDEDPAENRWLEPEAPLETTPNQGSDVPETGTDTGPADPRVR